MPYDGRLLSGVTVLMMAVVEAKSMVRAAEALGLTLLWGRGALCQHALRAVSASAYSSGLPAR